MELKLVDLTLETVSDGALEGRFQELLPEVLEICENASSYVGSSDGTRTTRIALEIEIRYRPPIAGDPASILIISGGEIAKRPKRHRAAQSAHVSDGSFVVVSNPPVQLEAFYGAAGIPSIARARDGGPSDGK